MRGNNRVIILACALGFGVLSALVALTVTIPGDAELVQVAVSARSEPLTHIIWVLTFISSSIPALLITLVVSGVELWRVRRFGFIAAWSTATLPVATWSVAAYLGNVACNIATRIAVGRLRPGVAYIPHRLPEVQASFQRFSYPSGHAGAALLAYTSLVILAWPHRVWRWVALVGALLVVAGTGFGRVYLGVHWPSDVLGGYLLAGFWLGIGVALRRWNKI
jgi:undecaprenyl-diphosphatase